MPPAPLPSPAAVAYQDFECTFSLSTCLLVLAAEYLIYFLIAVYLDNVLADKNGGRAGGVVGGVVG